MITIAGQTFEIEALSEEDHRTYRDYCLLLARHADRPVLRFIRTQCEGMTREERQDALMMLPNMPGWDEPPEELVLQWAKHPKAVAALCRRVLVPRKSAKEWEALIGDQAEAADAIYYSLSSALRQMMNPTDEEIIASNAALRAALDRPAKEAAKEAAREATKKEPEVKCSNDSTSGAG